MLMKKAKVNNFRGDIFYVKGELYKPEEVADLDPKDFEDVEVEATESIDTEEKMLKPENQEENLDITNKETDAPVEAENVQTETETTNENEDAKPEEVDGQAEVSDETTDNVETKEETTEAEVETETQEVEKPKKTKNK